MPVEFLSDEQATRYGRYHADPSPEQLARFFYLSPQDIRFLANYRHFYTKLGCAVQLYTLRFLDTFLPVPAVVVQTLSQQLHLPTENWNSQYTRPITLHDHQVPCPKPLQLGNFAHCAPSLIGKCRSTNWPTDIFCSYSSATPIKLDGAQRHYI